MKSIIIRLPLVAIALVTTAFAGACNNGDGSDNMSEEEAAASWSSVARSLSDDGGNTEEQALNIDINVDTEVDCRRSGEMSIDSQLGANAEDGDLVIAFDLGIDYDDCRFDDDTIDGDLDYSATFLSDRTEDGRESSLTYTYQGTIVVTDEDGEARTCVIDAEGVAQSEIAHEPGAEFRAGASVRYTGTICGHDADSVASASITISD